MMSVIVRSCLERCQTGIFWIVTARTGGTTPLSSNVEIHANSVSKSHLTMLVFF